MYRERVNECLVGKAIGLIQSFTAHGGFFDSTCTTVTR